MARLRPCPFCGGRHKLKKAARKCALAHGQDKPWTKKELGLGGK